MDGKGKFRGATRRPALSFSELKTYHLEHRNSPEVPHAVTVNLRDTLCMLFQM